MIDGMLPSFGAEELLKRLEPFRHSKIAGDSSMEIQAAPADSINEMPLMKGLNPSTVTNQNAMAPAFTDVELIKRLEPYRTNQILGVVPFEKRVLDRQNKRNE